MRLFRMLEDVLWPRALQCLCCESCTEGELLCPDCAAQLRNLRLPMTDGPVQSVWAYKECAGRLVRGLKDGCVADCAKVLAEGMAEVVREMQLPPDTVLTWVTMPRARRRVRGIDHGRILCEELAARTGLETRELLKRTGEGHTQRGLSRQQRLRNLAGRFACDAEIHGTVLLIDDVFTTGATAQACTEVLCRSGAEAVYMLTATRVTPIRHE